jgi:hypothetical protein
MKKIFTSLLLLMAAAVTANAEMTTVWTGSQEIGNWVWETRLELPASSFANIADGGQMVITMSRNTEDAGEEQWFQYEITANDYVAGRDPERTTIASGDLEADGDVTITLTAEQADLLRDYGMIINGHYVTITRVAIEANETEEGTTVTLWDGTPVVIGNWDTALQLSYDNKPAALVSAKVGDLITVTCTATGDNAQVQIANPEGWQPFDDDAATSLAASTSVQTFSYEIPDVATLEQIQFNGIIVNGANVTISKVELTTYPDSYDAVTITIEVGVATYSNSTKNLDFTGAAIKAYYATAVETGKVTLSPVTYVPANTGIVVKGEPGTYEIPTGEGENNAENYLKAIGDWAQTIQASTADVYDYIFDETAATFSLVAVATEVPARKAYLETSLDITPATGNIVLDFTDGGSTGINEVETDADVTTGDDAWYNLQGMRVARPTHGIYIHNGKKVMIK